MLRLRDILPALWVEGKKSFPQDLKSGPSLVVRPRKVGFSLWTGRPAGKPNLLVISRPDQDFKYIHFKGFNHFCAWSTDQGLEALKQKKDWDYIFIFSTMWAPGVMYQSGEEDVLAMTGAMNIAYEVGDLRPPPKLVLVWGPNVGKGRAVRDYLLSKNLKVGLMLNLKDKKALPLPRVEVVPAVQMFSPANLLR